MNKIKIVKFATSTIVGAGTSTITDAIIKNNIDYDSLNRFGVIQVFAARVVIGMMASSATREYTNAKIDEMVANLTPDQSDSEENPTPA